MPKPKLFEEEASDSDVEIKTNNDYATRYDTWREKEELNRLKNKYGDHARLNLNISEDESSSSEDDEDGKHLTEEFEKDFFKTLAYLKRKDPKIYDDKVVFFEKILGEDDNQKTKNKSKKQEPMFMKDYERKMILEKGPKFEDSDEEEPEDPRSTSPTYVEEQRRIKESLKKSVDDEDDNDEKWGGLFEKRQKSKEEQKKEEEDYMKWLKGTKEHLQNEEMETELNSLKEYWNKPDLNKDEAFLRDYLLNKKYLEKDDENHIPTYEEIIHDSDENLSEDEKNIEKQEEFEVKYNFRYEEPDQEFIKRYPRTMEQSVRKTDDRRKLKRAEIKERKEEEKKQKQGELKQLKILKRREIQEKIKMIKDITGNEQMAFQDMDIEGDFDPEEHDRRMQELFNDEYYGGDEGDQKPEFSDLDEELGPWKDNNELHCEDEDFNMDCDYNPEAANKNKKEKKKRDRPGKKQKNKQENDEDMPLEENEDQYGEYMDELYKLDYEDMIGDIPCRFKYRDVVPNDFGLSVEEILVAKDKELNRWCSLKKTTQYRPEQAEKYDVIAYRRKAANEDLKKKYLPSLYEPLEEELNNENNLNENTRIQFNDTENNENEQNNENKKPKKMKKNKNGEIKDLRENSNEKSTEDEQNEENENIENSNNDVAQTDSVEKSPKKKKRKHAKTENDIACIKINENISNINKEKTKKKNKTNNSSAEENENNTNTETNNKKSKNKNKINNNHTEENQNNANTETTEEISESKKMSRRQKKNKKLLSKKSNEAKETTATENRKRKLSEQNESTPKKKQKINETPKKKQKFNNKNKFKNADKKTKISDSRLEAYGINPKKFKNKLKYKNKKNVQ